MLKEQCKNPASVVEMTHDIGALVNCENSSNTVSNKTHASENTDLILFLWFSELVNEVVYTENSSLMCDAYLEIVTEKVVNYLNWNMLMNKDRSPQVESIQEFPDMAEIELEPLSSEIPFLVPINLPIIPMEKSPIRQAVRRIKWCEVVLLPRANPTDLSLTLNVPILPLYIPFYKYSLEDFQKLATE